jgi:hypothetical protein
MKHDLKRKKQGERPGYARVSAFRKAWEHIRSLRLDAVDHRTLAVVGIKGTAAAECLAALRFLGIVSEDGRATEGYRALQTGSSDALIQLVERAYGGLLAICPMPAPSRNQLERAMIAAYDLKQGRMAMAAAALFEWLYGQTGRPAVVGVEAPPARRRGSRRAGPERSRRGTDASPRRELPVPPPAPSGVIFALTITPQTTEAEIRAMLDRISAAHRDVARPEN